MPVRKDFHVLLCIRGNYLNPFGGDSVQLLKTADYLRRQGVVATINSGSVTDFADYDLIHLFNLTRITETYDYFLLAQKFHKPFVITPIYWDLERYYRYIDSPEQLWLWEESRPYRAELLQNAAMIFPSSRAEGELIRSQYGEALPCTTVYNGVDPLEFGPEAAAGKDRLGDPILPEGDFLLCAARVCPRKNQLPLSRAAEQLGLPLLLVGSAGNQQYLRKCLAHKGVSYWGCWDSSQLAALYRRARLHILCSLVETPGLSSLEAGACGCGLVTTREGSTSEYFGTLAAYCDPYEEDSLISAIETGLSLDCQPRLQTHILSNFSLDFCLKPLFDCYYTLAGKPCFSIIP